MDAGFVLHRTRYRETSLLVDFFFRDHGVVRLLVKGAFRGRKQSSNALQPFAPLLADWRVGSGLSFLNGVEQQGGQQRLTGDALYSAIYINELLLNVLERADPHPTLFDAYVTVLQQLGASVFCSGHLRVFELKLLQELGYAPQLIEDAIDNRPVLAGTKYCYIIERGPVADSPDCTNGIEVDGEVLLALHHGELRGSDMLRQAKNVTRFLIEHLLEGKKLRSRDLFHSV